MLQAPADSKFQRVLGWITGAGLIVVIFGLVTGLIPPPKHVLADSSHIVSVYFDGQQKVITTNAGTVSDALNQAGVTLGRADVAEPKLDTKIEAGYFNINVYRSRPVVVVDGASHKTVSTASQSPNIIAQAAGYTVYPEDTYDISTIDEVAQLKVVGQQVVIHRATALVLLADGNRTTVRTQQKTVGGLLNERDLALGPKDTVDPSINTSVSPGMSVQINRIKVVEMKQAEPIAFTIRTSSDPSLSIDTTKVTTPGVNGEKVSTFRVHYQNGVEQSRELLGQLTTKQPTAEVKIVGTKIDYAADPVGLGRQMAAERGWTDSQWQALYQLWQRESGWNPSSRNTSSGACGIPQASPCSKISDHSTAGQITWGLNYIAGKYGNPGNAWAYWQSHHSY